MIRLSHLWAVTLAVLSLSACSPSDYDLQQLAKNCYLSTHDLIVSERADVGDTTYFKVNADDLPPCSCSFERHGWFAVTRCGPETTHPPQQRS